MPSSARKSMGNANADWGVCGFTSSLYAMYEHNPSKRQQLNNANTAFRVLAEIKSYLMMLKADGEQTLLNSIVDFTQSFGSPFDTFNIDTYIARINAAVNQSENAIKADSLFGIAMPPEAVADYLKRIWQYDSTITTTVGGGTGNKDGILGVTSNNPTMPMYHGLEHYLYRCKGVVYSWGDAYTSVQDAANQGAGGANWQVCRLIEIN
ncbi:hypothetical protein SIN8267_01932 [Sinobacterium norvegicum]|uniref:Uncharacterized protein n=1 Tax=Sinobacterium norvegicum TaxID=1641715 RepID=A0ABN8EHK5_9GAMM|nr:hypothetical protein [Sinobacterium norvegicum]CAH0991817.1 hypothetical protein SIN8267_01932 [Sinobacterium norvegicum]